MKEIVIYGSQTESTTVAGGGSLVNDFIITATDLHNGSHISSFKQCSVSTNGLAVNDTNIYAVQTNKALLNIYNYGKDAIEQKIILPEQLSCIDVSKSKVWLAAGSPTGRLYLWNLKSGNMIFVKDVHFRTVSSVRFSHDETMLFTASDDSRVLGWYVQRLVSSDAIPEEISPEFSLSDNTLPITGLEISKCNIFSAKLYTSSKDATIRCYDIYSKELVSSFVLPEPVTAIAVDPAERAIYCGTESGKIHIIPLYQRNKQTGIMETTAGAGRVITVTDETNIFIQHETSISALTLSFDATQLISGDIFGKILSWDLPDRQVNRTLKQHRGPISRIYTIVRKTDEVLSPSQIPQLKRTLDSERNHKIMMQIPGTQEESYTNACDRLSTGENDLRTAELEANLSTVYAKYNEMKDMYQDLWKLHVSEAGVEL